VQGTSRLQQSRRVQRILWVMVHVSWPRLDRVGGARPAAGHGLSSLPLATEKQQQRPGGRRNRSSAEESQRRRGPWPGTNTTCSVVPPSLGVLRSYFLATNRMFSLFVLPINYNLKILLSIIKK